MGRVRDRRHWRAPRRRQRRRPIDELSDLCSAAEVSERTLEGAFHEVMGLAPMAYLVRLRLHRAREALLGATQGSTTVSAEALNWGSWHFGEFSRASRTASASCRRTRCDEDRESCRPGFCRRRCAAAARTTSNGLGVRQPGGSRTRRDGWPDGVPRTGARIGESTRTGPLPAAPGSLPAAGFRG
jgi:AraC-like DNA-binding protein